MRAGAAASSAATISAPATTNAASVEDGVAVRWSARTRNRLAMIHTVIEV
jgi:hypothetical protein